MPPAAEQHVTVLIAAWALATVTLAKAGAPGSSAANGIGPTRLLPQAQYPANMAAGRFHACAESIARGIPGINYQSFSELQLHRCRPMTVIGRRLR